MLRFLHLLALLLVPGGNGSLVQKTSSITMPHPLAQTLPWDTRVSGKCGKLCKTPRQIYSAAFKSTLIVASCYPL